MSASTAKKLMLGSRHGLVVMTSALAPASAHGKHRFHRFIACKCRSSSRRPAAATSTTGSGSTPAASSGSTSTSPASTDAAGACRLPVVGREPVTAGIAQRVIGWPGNGKPASPVRKRCRGRTTRKKAERWSCGTRPGKRSGKSCGWCWSSAASRLSAWGWRRPLPRGSAEGVAASQRRNTAGRRSRGCSGSGVACGGGFRTGETHNADVGTDPALYAAHPHGTQRPDRRLARRNAAGRGRPDPQPVRRPDRRRSSAARWCATAT